MMKKINFVFAIVLIALSTIAQSPQGFKYQGVIRDATGEPMGNTNVGIKISVLQGSASGTEVYSEEHYPTTNEFGLVTLNIGEGTNISGSFEDILWSVDNYFVKVALDPNGGSSFTEMGTSQLLSVPYAMYSKETENVDDADADPANELNTNLSLSGTTLQLTDAGGTINADLSNLIDDDDADPTNEIQTLSQNGSNVTLSNGGGTISINDNDYETDNELQTINKTGSTVTLSNGGGSFTDDVNDADHNPSNELQTLTQTGLNVTLSNGGGTINVADNDNDDSNELQTINKTGSTVTLSDGGGSFTDAVNDADAFPSNELQNLSISGNILTLSQGNSVTLPTGTTYQAGNGIIISGNYISADYADNIWNANKIQGKSIASGTPGTNQVLKWTGSNWSPSADNNTTYSAGNGISINGSTISNTGDLSNNNEIQNLSNSSSGTQRTISISGGGSGTTFSVADNDNDNNNEIQQLSASGSSTPRINISDDNSYVEFHGSGGISLSRSSNVITINGSSSSTPTLGQVLNSGNVASTNIDMNNKDLSSVDEINADFIFSDDIYANKVQPGTSSSSIGILDLRYSKIKDKNSSYGVDNYYLRANASGRVEWKSPYLDIPVLQMSTTGYDPIIEVHNSKLRDKNNSYGSTNMVLKNAGNGRMIWGTSKMEDQYGGSFLIDHPTKPNKQLRHNAVMSPENLCMYRGIIELNASGRGEVILPEYFKGLVDEKNATIILTVNGQPFNVSYEWNKQLTGFTVYGESNGKVSYLVLADRDDEFIRENRKSIIIEK